MKTSSFFWILSLLPPRNDVSPLSLPRRFLGYFSFILLMLIITPFPHGWYERFGIHCPYV